MSKPWEYPQVAYAWQIDNETASADLDDAQTTGMHLYIEHIRIDVHKAAAGGSGIIEIRDMDTGGENFQVKVDADAVNNFGYDFGEYGYGEHLEVILHSAVTTQASLSVTIKGHNSFQVH